ncbi:uncharacterized protein LOC121669230 [Corvus kubaryi]|uniref:uncharacterized protein LOC121669230 n=1 Tax=Corvus kubaryi TaxID=68294 RepID=UPI001C04D13F|nr:uncharacterized protein LOC121669230 [Corvus kubaryi]
MWARQLRKAAPSWYLSSGEGKRAPCGREFGIKGGCALWYLERETPRAVPWWPLSLDSNKVAGLLCLLFGQKPQALVDFPDKWELVRDPSTVRHVARGAGGASPSFVSTSEYIARNFHQGRAPSLEPALGSHCTLFVKMKPKELLSAPAARRNPGSTGALERVFSLCLGKGHGKVLGKGADSTAGHRATTVCAENAENVGKGKEKGKTSTAPIGVPVGVT